MSTLPIIDISPLYSDNKEDLHRVAHAIDNACRTSGFFYITGHGIPAGRVDELTRMAKNFFGRPLEEKNKIDITQSTVHRGYGGLAAEQLDPAQPSDWKETFDMSCHLLADHPDVKAQKPLRGPNRHPEDVPGWVELMEGHYRDMHRLALTLLRAIAIAIGIDEDFFEERFVEPLSVFRMIHYPALPAERGRVVCGEHTDYGIVTLLYQDGAGGLQVRDLRGEWVDAAVVPDSYVVNIGDMMSMWSNGRYRSTPHRVINPGVDRISMPFFCEPNPEVEIRCLPHCHSAEEPPKYPPVRAVDWLQQRFQQTYAYRNKA